MQPSQYEFIMGPQAPKKKLSLGIGSPKQRLLLVGVGAIVLLIVFSIAYSLLFGGGPSNKDELVQLAQHQQELIRVSEIGVDKARGTQARNLATTTQLSLAGEQKPLLEALKGVGVKISSKDRNASKSSRTDDMLNTAEQTNRFDEAFLEYLQRELVRYQQELNRAYQNTSSSKLKSTLKTQYENAKILANEEASR